MTRVRIPSSHSLKVVISSGAVLFGLILIFANNTYVRSSCWGHRGCDYFEKAHNAYDRMGLLAAFIGVFCLCKAGLPVKKFAWILLTVVLCVTLWLGAVFYSPSLVFVDAHGQPMCAHYVILG